MNYVCMGRADDPANVAGYDPTVTATVIYIYKDGELVTKIGNATKGGVVGDFQQVHIQRRLQM